MNLDPKDFSCIEIVKTLSKTRTNKQISSDFGISYSQINTWSSGADKPNKASLSMHYYTFILLEYFRRINEEETRKLFEEKNAVADVDDVFLGSFLFPSHTLESYMFSSISWKTNLIERLKNQNKVLLSRQIQMLETFARASYDKFPEKDDSDKNEAGEILLFDVPPHL